MKKISSFILIILAAASCSSPGDRLRVDVSDIRIPNAVIHRYDLDLFCTGTADLKTRLEQLRPQYPFFLNTDLSDSTKLLSMKDYLENERNLVFARACDSAFTDLGGVTRDLTEAFRHVAWYYPGFKMPRVYSYISGGDYQYPVQWADSVLLIGLDCYLGRDFWFYSTDQVPLYRVLRTERDYIVPDAMSAVYGGMYPAGFPGSTLLDQMVEAGKRILFIDAMLPESPGHLKMGYTPVQFDWASKNEEHVWAAIIANNLLYNTSGQTMRTFLADGPFTADFSKDSPPRLGEYIGWRILLQYLERNPEVTLQEVLKESDSQKILAGSRYKPEK
jgi:hypothetical protein